MSDIEGRLSFMVKLFPTTVHTLYCIPMTMLIANRLLLAV